MVCSSVDVEKSGTSTVGHVGRVEEKSPENLGRVQRSLLDQGEEQAPRPTEKRSEDQGGQQSQRSEPQPRTWRARSVNHSTGLRVPDP